MNINSSLPLLFIIDKQRDPYYHMACDEYFLNLCNDKKIDGIVRFYSWSPSALSVGRFFRTAKLDLKKIEDDGIPLVRRITGGNAIFHNNDFTYSVIMQKGLYNIDTKKEYYIFIGKILQQALNALKIKAEVKTVPDKKANTPDCFRSISQYELSDNLGKKVIGSAQKVLANAFLQHGSFFYNNNATDIAPYIKDSPNKKPITKDITLDFETITPLFQEVFEEYFVLKKYILDSNDIQKIENLIRARYHNKQWTFER